MFQNHAWVQYIFKDQDKSMDFSVKEKPNFILMISDHTLQPTFKKLLLGNFIVCPRRISIMI